MLLNLEGEQVQDKNGNKRGLDKEVIINVSQEFGLGDSVSNFPMFSTRSIFFILKNEKIISISLKNSTRPPVPEVSLYTRQSLRLPCGAAVSASAGVWAWEHAADLTEGVVSGARALGWEST